MSSFKDFIKEKNISLRTLSFETGIPYSTLSDLANERTDIEQMRFGYVMKIASFFSMSPEALYDICKPKIPQPDDGELFIKNKKYYQPKDIGYEKNLKEIYDKLDKIKES